MFEGMTVLITGGTGSWGQELVRRLLSSKPKEIRIFSRNEHTQVLMQQAFQNSVLKFIIGDVRDASAVLEACRNVDYVFHLAALKHVPICERQPDEALKTNVTGTEQVIKASIKQRVKKVINVSSDKAVVPINAYGMTKALGEKLMIRANEWSDYTRFVCIRGGNVLGSNGSVVPLFQKQILQNQEITLTSKEMTRFFISLSEAIELLLKASHTEIGGEIYVLKMRSCRIIDLAKVLAKQLTPNPIKIKEIGIRPGEKLHEILISEYESHNTYEYNEYFVILPLNAVPELNGKYAGNKKVSFEKYESSDKLMSSDHIEQLLRKGGFIGTT